MIYDNHNNNGGWRRDIDNTVYVITSNAFIFEYFKIYKFNKLLCPIKLSRLNFVYETYLMIFDTKSWKIDF